MKKFFDEYSKAMLIVFLSVCVFVIVCDVIQTFMAIVLAREENGHALALMAFGTGLMALLGYCYKSFKQKDSLNRNLLKISKTGEVSAILIDAEKNKPGQS
ncbi:MAG: hypothetical protein GX417_07190 [Clostridiales bacterium]|nr:hypothetical protein [Clostridiales bacterium]